MVSDEFLKRLAEEQENTQREREIICPYCKGEQSQDEQYSHISYHGEDSKVKIQCENCDKEFWVEEIVIRTFETTTIEWEEKENKRIRDFIEGGCGYEDDKE